MGDSQFWLMIDICINVERHCSADSSEIGTEMDVTALQLDKTNGIQGFQYGNAIFPIAFSLIFQWLCRHENFEIDV